MLKIHVNYVEIIDDESLWTKAGFASFSGAHIRLSAANRVMPNLLINWVDRMFALNDIIWRNLQRADKKGVQCNHYLVTIKHSSIIINFEPLLSHTLSD